MRVALVHDWLTGMRGGERCLEVACDLFPDADLFTLLHVRGSVSAAIERHRIVTSIIQRLPAAGTRYRYYLPLFPAALRRFDLSSYDLVLSLSHCVAKGARARPGALHISYCFTPMRYVWDLYGDYMNGGGVLTRAVLPPVAAALRRWDRASSVGVHRFIAISRYIADRITRCYNRDADVIYPPVDTHRFHVAEAPGNFYLVVSALVPYKRVDLAITAANHLRRRLLIVGVGPAEAQLRRLAGPTVEFLGWRGDREVAELYRECRALLFPGVEDFGIVPLEAMAAGRPVIAFGRGGALETVVPLDASAAAFPTGLFFYPQTADALVAAIERLETRAGAFQPSSLRAHAETFDVSIFRRRIAAYVEDALRC